MLYPPIRCVHVGPKKLGMEGSVSLKRSKMMS